jgi:Xaa-Pro aminopeptidase
MPPDTRARIRKLRILMKEKGLGSVFVTSNNDIYYYTGLMLPDSERGFLIIREKRPVLLISPLLNMYFSSSSVEVRHLKDSKDILKSMPPGRVGFDEKSMSVYLYRKLRKAGTKWIPFSAKIREPRMIKDDWEISKIRKAIRITESVLDGIKTIGRTESRLALEIENSFRERKANPAFETIVASGRNSAFIHYTPRERRISRKDLVIIDCGARVSGYCSDISRTFCSSPGKKERGLHSDARDIQEEIADSISPGTVFSEVQTLYERLMKKRGYSAVHNFGHGVGLDVHERPIPKDTFRRGMVFTIEPGIYRKGFGGVRIEDMFMIKKKARTLSRLDREL